MAFLAESRADRDSILFRHEESAIRLHDLFKQLGSGKIVISRPSPAFFSSTSSSSSEKTKNTETVLSPGRLTAGIGYVLGRLAFQHHIVTKAVEILSIADKTIRTENVSITYF